MNTLVIIDKDIDIQDIVNKIHHPDMKISLWSLTSDFLIMQDIQKQLQPLVNTKIIFLESAKLINCEVTTLQRTIHTWSSNLSHHRIFQKNLKEWFLLPDCGGSTWWLGLLSEKNSVQDNVFFKIAQMNALKNHLNQASYDTCLVAIADKRERNIIKKIANSRVHTLNLLKTIVPKNNIKTRIENTLQKKGLWGAFFIALIHWIMWLRDSRLARSTLPSLKTRINKINKNNSLLFVTYFPNIDEEAAIKGIFKNKYTGVLQDKLAELNMPVTWLAMPVFYNGRNFKSSVKLAKIFCDNGENLFLLQEFFTTSVFFKSLIWWCRQSILSIILWVFMDKKKLTAGLTDEAVLPLIQSLWWHSFVGMSGTRGMIFYCTYLNVFKTLPYFKKCLYYCEMQAWEKALNLAKKKLSKTTQTLAFQHTVVMRNFFNYFYDAKETAQQGKVADMPLPDKLIANGKLMYDLLAESKYPFLCEAEAIRQLYLVSASVRPPDAQSIRWANGCTKPMLLVVGSCDKTETLALITLVYTAFPEPTEFDIVFKGSPVNPLDHLFINLGLSPDKLNYKIMYNDISELLQLANIAIVANTTVAIEALALDCQLIIPLFADTMLMNPVIETKADYFLVGKSDELKTKVLELLQQNKIKACSNTKELINHYWNIDPHLPLWTNLLSE